jgi:hypothetical protein
MGKEKGFKPLPSMLRLLFYFVLFQLLFSILYLALDLKFYYPLFGFPIYGLFAFIIICIVNVGGPVALLFALLRRYKWTWRFGIGYFAIHILNPLMGVIALNDTVNYLSSRFPSFFSGTSGIDHAFVLLFSVMIALIHLVFLIIIYRNRSYFTRTQTANTRVLITIKDPYKF